MALKLDSEQAMYEQVILVLFSMSSLQREGEQCGDHHPEPTDYLKTMRADRMTRETHTQNC